jgi:hypothetical protein
MRPMAEPSTFLLLQSVDLKNLVKIPELFLRAKEDLQGFNPG